MLTEETAKMLNERNVEQFVAGQEICLGDYDMLIPDSVRKFIAGEWEDYPLEICNWLKHKDGWVNLNQQFINALGFTKNALRPIVDFWFDYAIESLKNPVKGMIFHNIWRDEETEDIVPWAMRTNKHLSMDSQVLKWRLAPYERMFKNMLKGKVKVPGMYSYMVADPGYVIGNAFGIDVPCMKSGENYFNNMDCLVGLFRSPLIAQQNAQKAKVVPRETYWYLKDVIVFNGFDGQWEFMSGADFDGDMCAIIPDNSDFGKLIVDNIIVNRPDLFTPGYDKVYTPFSFDNMEPYYRKLAEGANCDRTGVITDYATRSQEIGNHLLSCIEVAKDNDLDTITLVHPKEFGYDKSSGNYYGSNFTPKINRENKTLKIKGFVRCSWNDKKKSFVFAEEGLHGVFTLKQIENIAYEYIEKCNYTALKSYDEIDSAKTDVKAEGEAYGKAKRAGVTGEELEKLNEFVPDIKVKFGSHAFLEKKVLKGKEVTATERCNSYVSISPLGYMVSYANHRKHEIFDFFKEEYGVNLSSYLLSLLTAEELEQLNRPLSTKASGTKTIVDCLDERLKAYNQSIRNISGMKNADKSDDDGNEEENSSVQQIKEEEREFLLDKVANYYKLSPEVIAVATYICAYRRDTKKGLTFGWLLPEHLLSVFSRGNESFFNIPVKSCDVQIKDGYLYDNGKKRMPVDADDGDVLVLESPSGLVAHVHKRCTFVAEPKVETVYSSTKYTVKALGFAFYGETVESWKNTVESNNNEFVISFNENKRPCAFVNGKAISSVELGKDSNICTDKGVKVKVVSTPKYDKNSIRNIEIVVVE